MMNRPPRLPEEYRPLPLPQHVSPGLAKLVGRVFDEQLADVHWMLRFPPNPGTPFLPFTHSMTVVLLTVIAGVSSVLATIEGEPGEQFVKSVRKYFPWDVNPPHGTNEDGAAKILYQVFRNPLMHDAGLRIKGMRKVKTGRTSKHPVELESDDYLPTQAVPIVRNDAIVLWTDELYWSVRQMIIRTMIEKVIARRSRNGLPPDDSQRHEWELAERAESSCARRLAADRDPKWKTNSISPVA
jgi:hypothetical protein